MDSREDFSKRKIGGQAEDRACRFLKRHGYKILKQNWHLRFGEIDILAKNRAGDICLIEAKYQEDSIDRAKEQVDFIKQRQLKRLYLAVSKCYPESNVRIHVLVMDDREIELIEDAILDD
jgi:putative endonuclease